MSKVQRKLLSEIRPELRAEWNEDRNSELGLSFDTISHGTHKQVWWKCSVCGKEWTAPGSRRRALEEKWLIQSLIGVIPLKWT